MGDEKHSAGRELVTINPLGLLKSVSSPLWNRRLRTGAGVGIAKVRDLSVLIDDFRIV
jgi:hypothetical protein